MIDELLKKIEDGAAVVGVVGLGYVGLPLVLEFCRKGYRVIGFDIDPLKVGHLNAGESYIHHIPAGQVAEAAASGKLEATADLARIGEADAVLICVPTPLGRHREPDLSYVIGTAESIRPHMRAGQLIVLESTTYPGTTDGEMKTVLDRSGLVAGESYFLAFSPEREDPGNPKYSLGKIPKVVGGHDPDSLRAAVALYDKIATGTVAVSSTSAAEAVKLTENIFRAVNIALVNELKVIYDKMGVDVWEVIEAASSKPFGYMPFYPGPGLGGHCIPIDPFYLSWRAREFGSPTRFIELAGEINSSMPGYVVGKLIGALNRHGRSLSDAKVLLSGMAYKKDVDDTRESPGLHLFKMILDGGAQVDYYDPFVPAIPPTREHPQLAGIRSIEWDPVKLAGYDAIVIVTDHTEVDYAALVAAAQLVVDCRNATRSVSEGREKIVKA
ncbi:MAG TPA: nucleotide sugar dehydrogenase [Acidobacteriota bacterium]|nr:nucleotide sugar dehydrogenase [Acidobacteriota bacterium]